MKRLMTYTTHSPLPLVLLGLAEGRQEIEYQLHNMFKLDRLHGEWFRTSSELLSIVRAYPYADGAEVLSIVQGAEWDITRGRQNAFEMTKRSRRTTTPDRKHLAWTAR